MCQICTQKKKKSFKEYIMIEVTSTTRDIETGEEQGTEARVCFICLENCDQVSAEICLCKNLVCHPSCQLEMMRKMKSIKCGVCATNYKNARNTSRHALSSSGKTGIVIFSFMMFCACVTLVVFIIDNFFVLLIETLCLLAGAAGFLFVLLKSTSTYRVINTIWII